MAKTRRRKFALAFYLAVCGFVFTIEATICCFLKSYEYYPMLIPESRYDDGLAGNLFSQFCLAASAVLIAVYGLKNYWTVIFAGIYGLIELLFLRLGIYSQNWYRTWITVIGFTALFWAIKKAYHAATVHISACFRYILIFLGLYTFDLPVIKWIFTLNGIFLINMKLLNDGLSSYALTFLANLLIEGVCCMILYFGKFKRVWKAGSFVLLYIFAYAALKLGLYGIKTGWFLIFTTVDLFGTYLFIVLLDWLYGKRNSPA